MADLQDIAWETMDGPDLYARAIELAGRLGHHLFDTLYHAAAMLIPSAALVTADRAYFNKAKPEGQIFLLKDLEYL